MVNSVPRAAGMKSVLSNLSPLSCPLSIAMVRNGTRKRSLTPSPKGPRARVNRDLLIDRLSPGLPSTVRQLTWALAPLPAKLNNLIWPSNILTLMVPSMAPLHQSRAETIGPRLLPFLSSSGSPLGTALTGWMKYWVAHSVRLESAGRSGGSGRSNVGFEADPVWKAVSGCIASSFLFEDTCLLPFEAGDRPSSLRTSVHLSTPSLNERKWRETLLALAACVVGPGRWRTSLQTR